MEHEDPLTQSIDETLNQMWAGYYADRITRHNRDMNQRYGLHLETDRHSFYKEYLEILRKK